MIKLINSDATFYTQVAIINLTNNNILITPDSILYELHSLYDLYSEDYIHDELLKLTDFECWQAKHNLI